MFFLFSKYFLFCCLFSFFLASLMIGLTYVIAQQKNDVEKVSSYECGFDPFSDARDPFHVKFYLVSILFIIFDLEILFLFPWIISFFQLPIVSFYYLLFFLFIITLGFVYEWKKKAIDW